MSQLREDREIFEGEYLYTVPASAHTHVYTRTHTPAHTLTHTHTHTHTDAWCSLSTGPVEEEEFRPGGMEALSNLHNQLQILVSLCVVQVYLDFVKDTHLTPTHHI